MKNQRTRWLWVAVAATALIAASCGNSGEGKASTTTTAAAGGEEASSVCKTLKYEEVEDGGTFTDYAQLASAGDNTSFDPAQVQTLDEAQITNALFDGLVEFDYTDTCNPVLKPLVAESFEANSDATEFTFKIKDGLEFSNGEPVLPSNFKIAWERAGSKELGSSYGYLMANLKDGSKLLDGTLTTLDSIKADDDAMTLTATLEQPNADFPAITTFSSFSPISQEDFKRLGNTGGWGMKGAHIGNGPYLLESADSPDTGSVVLSRNDKWAGNVTGLKRAHLDKITFMISGDVEASYQSFEAGEGDSATIPPGKYGAAKEAYPNTVGDTQLATYFLDYGFDDPQLGGEANLDLRRAISMAIDRDEINRKVYEGVRAISTGITPPGIPGFENDLCEYCGTDAEKAKELFKKWEDAGGKLTTPIKLSLNAGGGHEDVFQIIQANLKDVLGIESELNPIEEDYFKVIAEKGACQICRSGWFADYPTYGNFMVDLFGAVSIDGNNLGRYDDPKFEELIAAAQKETDDTKRGELYREAEAQLLNETTGAIPLNWYTGDHVYREGVKNYFQPPLGLISWEYVSAPAS